MILNLQETLQQKEDELKDTLQAAKKQKDTSVRPVGLSVGILYLYICVRSNKRVLFETAVCV